MELRESILKDINEFQTLDKLRQVFLKNLTHFNDPELYVCYISRLKYLQLGSDNKIVKYDFEHLIKLVETEYNTLKYDFEFKEDACDLIEPDLTDESILNRPVLDPFTVVIKEVEEPKEKSTLTLSDIMANKGLNKPASQTDENNLIKLNMDIDYSGNDLMRDIERELIIVLYRKGFSKGLIGKYLGINGRNVRDKFKTYAISNSRYLNNFSEDIKIKVVDNEKSKEDNKI